MPEEQTITRIMPHSLEAEQSVIGSMILDQEAIEIATEYVTAEDFYSRQYGVIFEAITELYAKHVPVDPVTLQTRLKEKNLPPETYSAEMIGTLIATVPTSANVRAYADIVAQKSTLRRMIRAAEGIGTDCYTEKDSLETILDRAEKSIFEIAKQ